MRLTTKTLLTILIFLLGYQTITAWNSSYSYRLNKKDKKTAQRLCTDYFIEANKMVFGRTLKQPPIEFLTTKKESEMHTKAFIKHNKLKKDWKEIDILGYYNRETGKITIFLLKMESKKMLKQVYVHELIHHCEMTVILPNIVKSAYKNASVNDILITLKDFYVDHGNSFRALMKKANDYYGKGFIEVKYGENTIH
jgi:hypothetical protein